jgi:hypothetical protein
VLDEDAERRSAAQSHPSTLKANRASHDARVCGLVEPDILLRGGVVEIEGVGAGAGIERLPRRMPA